jgi:hypothetical protein
LFSVGRSTITEHINNILNDGELNKETSVGKTDVDNSKKPVKIYYTMQVKFLLLLQKNLHIKNTINLKQDKLYKSDFDIFINEARIIENGSDSNE